jgi:hypothetical protein
MKVSLWKSRSAQVACLSLWPILLFAQAPDLAQSLDDCKNDLESCPRARLSEAESADVAHLEHRRNLSNCRNGYNSPKISGPLSSKPETESARLIVTTHPCG